MRKIRILAITLVMILGLSLLPVLAASSSVNPKQDAQDPKICIRYSRTCGEQNNGEPYKMTVETEGLESGILDLDSDLYEPGKDYSAEELCKTDDDGYWFTSDKTLYSLNCLSVTSPDEDPAECTDDSELFEYAYEFELVPVTDFSVSRPATSSVMTICHSTMIMNTEEKYLVNGTETTKEEYDKAKEGHAYKEKSSTRYIEDISSTLRESKYSFLGLEIIEVPVMIGDEETTISRPKYSFQNDEYYDVQQRYLKTYELTTMDIPGGDTSDDVTPSAATDTTVPSAEAAAVKPTVKVKASITKLKASKKSLTVKWKKPSAKNLKKISGYQVQISTKRSFPKAATKTYKVGKKSTSKKITKLRKKTRYYVRVRAVKGKNVGKWSKIKSVKTK